MVLPDGPLKNLCDRHKGHPESIAVSIEMTDRERDPNAPPDKYEELSSRLRSCLEEIELADMIDDDRNQAIREKHTIEQKEEHKRLCRLAAAKFLRRVGNEIGGRAEWTMEDFKENLPEYIHIAFDVSQEEEIPLSDLHDAIDEVVASAFSEPIVNDLHDEDEEHPKFLPPVLSGRIKVTQNLIERVIAGKSEDEMRQIHEEVRGYCSTELHNLMKRK